MKRAIAVAAATLALATTTPAVAAHSSYGAPGLGDPYYPLDGNGGYDVQHYGVRVSYNPAQADHLTGDTTITAKAKQDLDRFNLDLEGFDVTSVQVNGQPARKVTRELAHELVITPRQRIHAGTTFTVRVRYDGKAVGQSWKHLQGGGIVVTGEPHSATAWYPANDHPSDKATFDLTATVPTGWTVIGNGQPERTSTSQGKKTFHWSEDKPLATYLSTIAIDKFDVHNGQLPNGVKLIHAYGSGTTRETMWEDMQPEILAFLTDKFGPYPFSTAGATVVQSDGTGSLALETQGRPTYEGGFFDASAVHENSHQWFGNSVTIKDWRDACLNECFAQYIGQLWEEKQGADLDTSYREQVEAARGNPEFWDTRLYDAGAGKELHQALYFKGSLMMHALRRAVGDDKYFGTVRAWLHAHRYGNASWPEFETFIQQHTGQDLTGFFAAWAHGTTVPAEQYLFPAA